MREGVPFVWRLALICEKNGARADGGRGYWIDTIIHHRGRRMCGLRTAHCGASRVVYLTVTVCITYTGMKNIHK